MGPVARIHEISAAQRGAAPNCGSLLADHQTDRCFHLVLMVPSLDFLFDSPDSQHCAVPPHELFG
jgi:hypothetical protein